MAKAGRRNNWMLVLCPRCGREISSNPSHRRSHEQACAKKYAAKEQARIAKTGS